MIPTRICSPISHSFALLASFASYTEEAIDCKTIATARLRFGYRSWRCGLPKKGSRRFLILRFVRRYKWLGLSEMAKAPKEDSPKNDFLEEVASIIRGRFPLVKLE